MMNNIHSLIAKGKIQQAINLLKSDEGPSISKEVDANGNRPIHCAVSHQRMQVVQFLIEKDASCLKEQDKAGRLPIHLAVANTNNNALVKLILDKNPSGAQQPDINGELPLHIAARKGRGPMVRDLLSHYPDGVDHKNRKGQLPFDLCPKGKHKLRQLLQANNNGQSVKEIDDVKVDEPVLVESKKLQNPNPSDDHDKAKKLVVGEKESLENPTDEYVKVEVDKPALTDGKKLQNQEPRNDNNKTDKSVVGENKKLQDATPTDGDENVDKSVLAAKNKLQNLKSVGKDAVCEHAREENKRLLQQLARQKQGFQEDIDRLQQSHKTQMQKGKNNFLKERDERNQSEISERSRLEEEKEKLEKELTIYKEIAIQSRALEKEVLRQMLNAKEENQACMSDLKSFAKVLMNRIELIQAKSTAVQGKATLVQLMFPSFISHPDLTKDSLLDCIEQLNTELLGLEAAASGK